MADQSQIPMFPLSIFPLPGEMVPLHIFEPRYRQLLDDAEVRDFSFGIYFNHVSNIHKFGSLVKLESVIKRYAGGESDIIVKCYDLFTMETLYKTYRDKLYPGGEVSMFKVDTNVVASAKIIEKYNEFAQLLNITHPTKAASIYHIANDLNLDFESKLRFVATDDERKENYLHHQLNYHLQLFAQVEKAKDVFHLN